MGARVGEVGAAPAQVLDAALPMREESPWHLAARVPLAAAPSFLVPLIFELQSPFHILAP